MANQEPSQPPQSQLPTTSEVVEGERENDSIDIHSLMIDAMNDTDEMVSRITFKLSISNLNFWVQAVVAKEFQNLSLKVA